MDRLHKDVLSYIGMKLSLRDIFNLSLTCKRMKFDNHFWRNKIKYDFPSRSDFSSIKYKEMYLENPKQLYLIINSKCKKIILNIEDFSDEDVFDSIESIVHGRIISEESNKKIKEKIKNYSVLKGDVFNLDWIYPLFNEDFLFWDGEKLIRDDNYDEEGNFNIPRIFTFPEFPIEHFLGFTYFLIWLSDSSISEAIKNFNIKTQRSFITDKYNKYMLRTVKTYHSIDEFAKFIRKKNYISSKLGDEYIIGPEEEYTDSEEAYEIEEDEEIEEGYDDTYIIYQNHMFWEIL